MKAIIEILKGGSHLPCKGRGPPTNVWKEVLSSLREKARPRKLENSRLSIQQDVLHRTAEGEGPSAGQAKGRGPACCYT